MEKTSCNFCDKKFEAYSKDQAEYMKIQHTLARHPEKVFMKELGTGKIKSYKDLLEKTKKQEDDQTK